MSMDDDVYFAATVSAKLIKAEVERIFHLICDFVVNGCVLARAGRLLAAKNRILSATNVKVCLCHVVSCLCYGKSTNSAGGICVGKINHTNLNSSL